MFMSDFLVGRTREQHSCSMNANLMQRKILITKQCTSYYLSLLGGLHVKNTLPKSYFGSFIFIFLNKR